jgi:hypothetical protein
MGAVEDTRKVIKDFLAPEMRTLSANMESIAKEQLQIRHELIAVETRSKDALRETESRLLTEIGRTRADILASESRLSGALDRLRSDIPLLVRNAVLEDKLAEKQRIIEDFQKQQAH